MAVSSIVDKMSFPARLMHILEGEVAAQRRLRSRHVPLRGHSGADRRLFVDGRLPEFPYAVSVGMCGAAALFAAAKALQLLNRIGGVPAEAQVLVMILLPFVAYLGAEHFGASGILASVTAGLLTGGTGIFRYLGVSARIQTMSLWATRFPSSSNGALVIVLGVQLPDIIRRVPPELTGHYTGSPAILTCWR